MSKNASGFVLPALIAFIVVFMISVVGIAGITVQQNARTNDSVVLYNADQAAEAGIEQTILALNASSSFTGYAEQDYYNDPDAGRARFTTSVVDAPESNAKFITSTGTMYAYNESTNPKSTRTIRVTVVGTGSSSYNVYGGPGGLILGGSANILNSDVYVGGYLELNGGSKIGSENGPVTVNVANKRCPSGNNPGATYPAVCSTGQPIIISDWSSVAILGTTCATGQTQSKFPESPYNNNPPQIRAASSGGAGLVSGCVAPEVSPLGYDKATHVSNVAITSSATDNNQYACTNWRSNGEWARTWPANLRLNGNSNISSSCDITLNGDVYITGNFTLGGGAKLRVPDSVGTTPPTVLVDGKIDVGGGASIVTNAQGTSVRFVSVRSNAACNPNCTALSGNALKSSQNLETIKVSGGVNMPGSSFNAVWGKLTVSGSGSVGQAAGQTIDMSGAGSITFGTGLDSGDKTWKITSYQRIFN